jgi:23S rRNA (cytidine2498-2'-O)-methyltransferase
VYGIARVNTLLAVCRPGFEGDCAAALADACGALGLGGHARAQAQTGFVHFVVHDEAGQPVDAIALLPRLSLDELVFVRALYACSGPLRMAPPDRLSALPVQDWPVLSAIGTGAPDTNEGRELAALARNLEKPLVAALAAQRVRRQEHSPWSFLWFMADGETAFACVGHRACLPPWPLGVPRLRLSGQAPSRSALKLEEAWHVFLGRDAFAAALAPRMTAVDLGAAPGGWTWLMAGRGMRVEAVDNGPLAANVAGDILVTHVRADGFTFRPRRPVDWVVCDMVEQPSRVGALMARWLAEGWCRRAIFNLKLPMKKRHAEVQTTLARLCRTLDAAGLRYRLRARQLYHDREEITVFVAVDGREA